MAKTRDFFCMKTSTICFMKIFANPDNGITVEDVVYLVINLQFSEI